MTDNLEEEEGVEISLEEYLANIRPYSMDFGEFNKENYRNFLEEINNTNHIVNRDFYLDSNGGNASYINPMKRVIEKGDLKLIASDRIISAAFLLFLSTKVDKEILHNTYGMFHYPYPIGQRLNPNFTPQADSEIEKALLKKDYHDKKFFKELLEIDKETDKMLMKGGELVYNTAQLKKLLKKSNQMLGI